MRYHNTPYSRKETASNVFRPVPGPKTAQARGSPGAPIVACGSENEPVWGVAMRQNILKIYLDDDEWNHIVEMAENVAMPLSGFVRTFLLTQKPPRPRATGVTIEAVAALNRTGALLNQIARVANRSQTLSAAEIRGVAAARERLLVIAEQLEGGSV
jgi:hypothetical protein